MSTVTSVSIEQRSETEILNFLLGHAMDNDLPIAFWRLPHTSKRFLVIAQQALHLSRTNPIEELPPGFMFAAFDREKDSIFIPADYFFAFEGSKLKEAETPIQTASCSWLSQTFRPSAAVRNPGEKFHSVPSDNRFVELVQKSIHAIGDQRFEKVVASRTKIVDLSDDFDIVETFEKLCTAYPQALVSFVSIPGTGHWMGATPESLVSVQDKNIFKTVALAGTLPYKEGMNLKSVAWTEKEIEEQALVERYVISCFKKIRLREYDEHGPKTMIAGNLLHLKSEFTVDMAATNFPQLGTVMLQLLHPTSAVCGMPLEPAIKFLKEHEGYDREFYSGFLGPVNIENNINLFVNLRCMKLLDQKALLFAGAGITIDSDPEQELAETDLKFNTLLNVIR